MFGVKFAAASSIAPLPLSSESLPLSSDNDVLPIVQLTVKPKEDDEQKLQLYTITKEEEEVFSFEDLNKLSFSIRNSFQINILKSYVVFFFARE